MNRLTHLDKRQRPSMVDVSPKVVSYRVATAAGRIVLQPATAKLIKNNRIAKGNVLVTAELAGIQAAKQTAGLIPLCHTLLLTHVVVVATLRGKVVEVRSEVRCTGQTGVEMEALTAVSVALLTVYDMCKAVDGAMRIMDIRLLKKTKEPASKAVVGAL